MFQSVSGLIQQYKFGLLQVCLLSFLETYADTAASRVENCKAGPTGYAYYILNYSQFSYIVGYVRALPQIYTTSTSQNINFKSYILLVNVLGKDL